MNRAFGAVVFLGVFLATPVAAQTSCVDHEDALVQRFCRYDIKGFYFAAGQTLTTKAGGVAQTLLESAELEVEEGVAFPAGANLIDVWLYWSGSREVADAEVTLTPPGGNPTKVVAERCYR